MTPDEARVFGNVRNLVYSEIASTSSRLATTPDTNEVYRAERRVLQSTIALLKTINNKLEEFQMICKMPSNRWGKTRDEL